jgi:uncharacterized membrane protein
MKTLSKIVSALVLTIALINHHTLAGAQSQMIDLGTLGGMQSGAVDINDNNQIVGSSETVSGDLHALGKQHHDGLNTKLFQSSVGH